MDMRTKFSFKDKDVCIFELSPSRRFYLNNVPSQRLRTVSFDEFEYVFKNSVFCALESFPEFVKECESLYGDDVIEDYLIQVILDVPNVWLTDIIDEIPDPIMCLIPCFREAPRLGHSKLYIKFLYCLPIGLSEDEFKCSLSVNISQNVPSQTEQLLQLQYLIDQIDDYLNRKGA